MVRLIQLLYNRLVWFMVFNATFNTISVISWRSVLLVEETGVPGENYRPVASH
jgi:energy-converting hydrogenase Eha subunit E